MRRNLFLAAATATALSASLLAGSSLAEADTPTGGPVLVAADGWYSQPGMVFVTAHSDSPITAITAHFYPLNAPDGAPEAGSAEDFTQYSGPDATSGTWRAPVHLADLGEYRVTVDLQDASGATVTGVLSPQTLEYQTVVTIPDLTAAPSVPDYLHQQVTVTGTVLAEDPRHPDTPAPADGVPVVIDTGRGQVSAAAAADGRFTASFIPTQPSVRLTAAPLATSSYPGAIDLRTPPQYLHTLQAPVRFSASTHTLDLRQGTTGTVTGHAEIQTASGWQPLPHTSLTLLGLSASGLPQFAAATTTTDSQGNYTLHIPSDNPAPTAELLAGTDGMPFQQVATQPFSLHIAYTTHIAMSALLNDDSTLHASGNVTYSDPRAHWPTNPTVTLEYSKDGKSGWKSAATIPLKIRYNKPQFPESFARAFTAPANAYWRARFNGNPDLATSTTKPVHLYRYATRITGFHASPDPVRKGYPIRFTGTLQYNVGGIWKPLSGGSPALYFRPRGSTTYHLVCDLGTDRYGHIKGMATATQDGTWAIAFNRQTGAHYLKSPWVTDYVDIR